MCCVQGSSGCQFNMSKLVSRSASRTIATNSLHLFLFSFPVTKLVFTPFTNLHFEVVLNIQRSCRRALLYPLLGSLIFNIGQICFFFLCMHIYIF